jgi:peptidoglycan/LPS O-acetylase OafA/YrhL
LAHGADAYYLFAIVVVSPALILLGTVLTCRNRFVLWAMQLLGWISYPIYCVHYPVIRLVSFLQTRGWRFPLSSVLVVVIVSLLIATVLTLVYDQPVRNWLGRSLKRPRPTVLAAPTLAE